MRSDYSGQTFKHILAPVWLLTYTYRRARVPVRDERRHRRVRGEYPKSPWKIALLVLAIFIVVRDRAVARRRALSATLRGP